MSANLYITLAILATSTAVEALKDAANAEANVQEPAQHKPSPWDSLDYFTSDNNDRSEKPYQRNKVLKQAIIEAKTWMQKYKESQHNVSKRNDVTTERNDVIVAAASSFASTVKHMEPNDMTTVSPGEFERSEGRSNQKKRRKKKLSNVVPLTVVKISGRNPPIPEKRNNKFTNSAKSASIMTNLIVDDYYSDVLDSVSSRIDPKTNALKVVQHGGESHLDSGAIWMIIIVLSGLIVASVLVVIATGCLRYHSKKKTTATDCNHGEQDFQNKDYPSDVFFTESGEGFWSHNDTSKIDMMSSIPNNTMSERIEIESECGNEVSLASSSSSMLSLVDLCLVADGKETVGTGPAESLDLTLTLNDIDLPAPETTLPTPKHLHTIEHV